MVVTDRFHCIPYISSDTIVAPVPPRTAHYSDLIMSAMASHIIGIGTVYSTVCSGAYQRKHQSSASPAFVRRIHRANSSHKGPVMRKMFSFDDVIMDKKTFVAKIDLTHPSPWAKWPSFRRRYIPMYFHEWKVLYFYYDFTAVCSLVSSWQ